MLEYFGTAQLLAPDNRPPGRFNYKALAKDNPPPGRFNYKAPETENLISQLFRKLVWLVDFISGNPEATCTLRVTHSLHRYLFQAF